MVFGAAPDYSWQQQITMHFRFTIRDLLWLTALVAILLAWRFSQPTAGAGRYQWIGTPSEPMLIDTDDGSVWAAHLTGNSYDGWELRVPKMLKH